MAKTEGLEVDPANDNDSKYSVSEPGKGWSCLKMLVPCILTIVAVYSLLALLISTAMSDQGLSVETYLSSFHSSFFSN